MKRIILSLSIVLAAAMNMQGSNRNPFVKFSIDNIDYHIQQSYGTYGTVWASDTKEPYATGTEKQEATKPPTVIANQRARWCGNP